MRAWITISLVLALLLGSGCADDVAEVTTAHRPSYKSAWQFIKSRGDLNYTAYVLEVLGLSSSLANQFSGTLLLPTDAAWAKYREGYALWPNEEKYSYVIGPAVFNLYKAFTPFFGALMNYHTLRWAVGTSSPWSLIVDTNHVQAPGFDVPSMYHQVTFVNRKSRKPPRKLKGPLTNTVTTSMIGHKAIKSIRDEQGNSAMFVSANNKVSGGGVIHIINTVLQPDDVYPSFTALVAANPQFKQIADIIEWWEQQSEDEYSYHQNGYPWWDLLRDHTCYEYRECTWVPIYQPERFRPSQAVAGQSGAAGRASLRAWQEVESQRQEKESRKWEHMIGTMALPENSAVLFNPYNITPGSPEKWPNLLQYHFIHGGANSRNLVRWNSSSWHQKYTTYLGIFKSNYNYTLSYGGSARSLTITFSPIKPGQTPVAISRDNSGNFTGTYKKQMNLQTPGKFYHSTATLMVPDIPGILDGTLTQ